MTKLQYARQLEQILTVADPTNGDPEEAEYLRMLCERIESDKDHSFVLKNAAALMHAQGAVRQIRNNIAYMRWDLQGQLAAMGIKEWRLGIRK